MADAENETGQTAYAHCPACGSAALITVNYPTKAEKWRDLQVIVCESCGFGFVPSLDFDLNEYYANDYGKSHRRRRLSSAVFDTIDSNPAKKVRRAHWHAEMLNKRFGTFGSVLDIGAGPGFFLHYIKADKKYAIEFDTLSHPLLKALNVDIVGSLAEVADLDLIVMSHALEHFLVQDYRNYVSQTLAALKPGGLLLIEVPEWSRIDKVNHKTNGQGHEPHTLFFSPEALLKSVDAELVYFHDKKNAFGVSNGVIDYSNVMEKEFPPSSLMGIWKKN